MIDENHKRNGQLQHEEKCQDSETVSRAMNDYNRLKQDEEYRKAQQREALKQTLDASKALKNQ